jgi:hypothetical protein
LFSLVAVAAALAGCAPIDKAIRPAPPGELPGAPAADPPPSRVVVHATIFREAIAQKLEASLPLSGEGDADVFAGHQIHYSWARKPLELRFDRGRIVLAADGTATARFLGAREFPLHFEVAGEPVVTAEYRALLQSPEVEVRAAGAVDRINRRVEEKLRALIERAAEDFHLDARPLIADLLARVGRPLELPISADRKECVAFRVVALEAGPTVLADGVERDLAASVLPETVACSGAEGAPAAALPLLQNVAALPAGPFRVLVPLGARYEELGEAVDKLLANQFHYSKSQPALFVDRPRLFSSGDEIVLQVSIGGTTSGKGRDANVSGELYFAGHPQLAEGKIAVPDLSITAATAEALAKAELDVDQAAVAEQARAAMRIDLAPRLAAIKDRLSKEMSFDNEGGCVRAEVLRAEVTGLQAQASFLRAIAAVDAQAALFLPCRR